MFKKVTAVAAFAVIAGPAAADWIYRPSEASDDLGSAYVRNAQGHMLDINCGNAGIVGFMISPDLRIEAERGRDEALYSGQIDSNDRFTLPLNCSDNLCVSGMLPGQEMWPIQQRSDFVSALKNGSKLAIWSRDQKVAEFSLAGSAAALGQLKAADQICEGL